MDERRLGDGRKMDGRSMEYGWKRDEHDEQKMLGLKLPLSLITHAVPFEGDEM